MERHELEDTLAFRKELMEKVEHLHDCFETKNRDSETRITANETRLTVLETEIGFLLKVSWLLFGSSVVVVIGALLKIVIK